MKKCLKLSLERTWKYALTLDWISAEKAKSLPLLEFYQGLRWRKLEKAMKNYKVQLTSIYDILNVVDSCDRPWPMNILIIGTGIFHQGGGSTNNLFLISGVFSGFQSQRWQGSLISVFSLEIHLWCDTCQHQPGSRSLYTPHKTN